LLPATVFGAALDRQTVAGEWRVEGYEGMFYQFDADGTMTIQDRYKETQAIWDVTTLRGTGYIVMYVGEGGYFFANAELNGNKLVIREVCQGSGGKIYMSKTDKSITLKEINFLLI
jgi:hypothetical protein